MSVDNTFVVIVFCIFLFVLFKLTRTNNGSKNISARKKSSVSIRKSVAINNAVNNIQPVSSTLPLDNDEEKTVTEKVIIPEDFLSFKLFSSADNNDQVNTKINDICLAFRKPHPLLLPLAQGSFEPNTLFDLIKTDPEMTAKVLNVVNSSMFALRQPITSIHHAIVFLGVGAVKSIALQFAMLNDLAIKDEQQAEALKKLWSASYIASSICLLIAKELGKENSAELSTHCLLCYLGDMAMLSYDSSLAEHYHNDHLLYAHVDQVQRAIGANSAIVGKTLAQQWQLPTSIVEAIEHSLLLCAGKNVAKDIPYDALQNILICYAACRIGDKAAFEGINDISQMGRLGIDPSAGVDFHYFQENISPARLDKLNTLFSNEHFIRKANGLIAQVVNK